MKKLLTYIFALTLSIIVLSALYTVGAADTEDTQQGDEDRAFCEIFSFLGYSVNEEKTSITAGYNVNRELLDEYCRENGIGSFDFGCSFGVNGVFEDNLSTSFAKYTKYQTFNARIKGFDQNYDKHLNAVISLALYVNRGNGREYVVEIDGEIAIVGKEQIPTITYGSLISK
jgi:hypothetical protein